MTPVDPGRAGGLVGQVYRQLERDFGLLAPPVTLHSPAPEPLAAAWMMLRETLLADGTCPRAAREAVAVGVSRANSCPYCVEIHGTALYGLAGAAEATAVNESSTDGGAGGELSRVARWARTGEGWSAPRSAAEVAELVGTAVTFHYLNRMVNIFLVETPIPGSVPPGPRRAARRAIGRMMRPLLRKRVEPGGSLSLLPEAPLPPDLSWAAGRGEIAGAFARAAAAIEEAAAGVAPPPVRELLAAQLDRWDGTPPGPTAAWAARPVDELPAGLRPAGRLALLTAIASYQVGQSVIDAYRRHHPEDRSLVALTSWASLTAARREGLRRSPPAIS